MSEGRIASQAAPSRELRPIFLGQVFRLVHAEVAVFLLPADQRPWLA